VTRSRRAPAPGASGLGALRRIGAVSDLLFLYESTTRDVGQLRAIAEPLGLTVQATSHTFRSLARRGLAELRDGRYRPTVAGVAWMHAALGGAEEDLRERLERLHIVRTTYAVAAGPIRAGESVALSLVDGTLSARPRAGGASRGIARHRARPGELVEVTDLEGIVPLRSGTVRLVVLPSARLRDPGLPRDLSKALRSHAAGLLASHGPEAYHTLARALPGRPIVRFGVAAAASEAASLGIDCVLVTTERDLPRLLHQLEGARGPSIEYLALPAARSGSRSPG
jgi:predicted transcriptional regulator